MKLSTSQSSLLHTIFRDLLVVFLFALVWHEVFQPIQNVVTTLAVLTIASGVIATLAEPQSVPVAKAPAAQIELGAFIVLLLLGAFVIWRQLASLGIFGAILTILAVLLIAGLFVAYRNDLLSMPALGDLKWTKVTLGVVVLSLLILAIILWLVFGPVGPQALLGSLYIFGFNGLLWSYVLFASGKLIGPMRIALAGLIGLGLFPVLAIFASRLGIPVTAANLLILNTIFCAIPLVMLRLRVSLL